MSQILGGMYLAAVLAPGLFSQQPAPPPRATNIARQVVTNHPTSYLGVAVADIDGESAKALNLKDEHGVEVKSVKPDSPAAKAGIKEGDVVLEFNGQRVEGTEQFVRLVHETPAGRSCTLLLSRNGAPQTVTAAVGMRRAGDMYFFDLEGADAPVTPVPPMPQIRIPDVPHTLMSWRSSILGIETESLSSQLAEFFGVKDGVLVRAVLKDSTAEKAGFKAGDVIVKVDGEKVTTPREISSLLHGTRTKKIFPVTVVRSRKEITINVTLDENGRNGQNLEGPREVL